jgi:DNA invertase Pin-like site-specific DNA recombinase
MRYAAYCRVSTGSDEQLNSLVNQRNFFEEYANKRGDILVRIYADRGISGKSMEKRPEFLRLLEDCTKGEFDAVLVKDISRFARNTLDFLTGIRTLKSNGIDVIFVGANQKVLGESEFVLTLFAALAQEESCALSKKIVFGKKQGAKRGRVPNIIYGYDKLDTYNMKINLEEANVVKRIFDMYTKEDKGYRKIALCLNSDGVKTKLGNEWNPKGVKRVLCNPLYRGELINNKSETADFLLSKRQSVPPNKRYCHKRENLRIISDEIFFLAQKKLEEKSKNVGTNRSG